MLPQYFISFMLIAFTQMVFARNVPLVQVFADNFVKGENSRLEMQIDDLNGNIIGIIKKGVDAKGKHYENFISANPKDLIKGIVLHTDQGRDILKLKSTDVSDDMPVIGGELKLLYLNNGLRGTYYSKPLKLIRNSFDDWKLTYNNIPFSRMMMRTNSVLGLVVGISDIKFE